MAKKYKNKTKAEKQKFNQYCMNRWKKIKLLAIEYKGGKCSCCGYNDYIGALEFHHKDPTQKEVSWDKLRLRSWDKIKEELDKCVLLCSNCHREEHSEINYIIEEIEESPEDYKRKYSFNALISVGASTSHATKILNNLESKLNVYVS